MGALLVHLVAPRAACSPMFYPIRFGVPWMYIYYSYELTEQNSDLVFAVTPYVDGDATDDVRGEFLLRAAAAQVYWRSGCLHSCLWIHGYASC